MFLMGHHLIGDMLTHDARQKRKPRRTNFSHIIYRPNNKKKSHIIIIIDKTVGKHCPIGIINNRETPSPGSWIMVDCERSNQKILASCSTHTHTKHTHTHTHEVPRTFTHTQTHTHTHTCHTHTCISFMSWARSTPFIDMMILLKGFWNVCMNWTQTEQKVFGHVAARRRVDVYSFFFVGTLRPNPQSSHTLCHQLIRRYLSVTFQPRHVVSGSSSNICSSEWEFACHRGNLFVQASLIYSYILVQE